MSDRKESLLRTIKLQNEQLEQWEKKRTTSGDPDERLRCDDKISDIKVLIKQNEDELKKLKGGKQVVNPPVTTIPVAAKMTYNKIGFNSHKDFSENKTNENIKDSIADLQKIGDEYDPDEINIPHPVVNTIASTGNYIPEYIAHVTKKEDEDDEDNVAPAIVNKNVNQTKLTPQLIISALLWLAVTILMFTLRDRAKFLNPETAPILLGSVLAGIAITLLYLYDFTKLQLGSKFVVSLVILNIYAAVFFWEVRVFGHGTEIKPAGEVIILPVFIASIILLIERNWKKSH